VRIKIKDDNGILLADTFTMGGSYGILQPFHKEVFYDSPTAPKGVVEIFEDDVKDGGEINKIIIPVVFGDYSDETADWKTYTNEEYGFEFKYPGEWNIAEKRFSIGSCAVRFSFSADKDKNYEFYPWSRNINIEVWYSHESDETIAHSGVMGMITENKNSDLKIDGIQAKKFICGIADQLYDTGIHNEHKLLFVQIILRTPFGVPFLGTKKTQSITKSSPLLNLLIKNQVRT